ncbi:hypothetical protein Pint_11876 [Pistacia integerrima]|uniref:Uncharacterized protein n=1 Tax=Pistacia integerrima TaxID=434235 RepID=A0ACC0XGD4_9ROSI|nr:hypothetical protein Pint_11876 [Pistacia integerrima]
MPQPHSLSLILCWTHLTPHAAFSVSHSLSDSPHAARRHAAAAFSVSHSLSDSPHGSLTSDHKVLIASYISKGDFKTIREVTNFMLKIGVVTGVSLAAILGVSFGSLATLFTKDPKVLGIVRTGILVSK